MKTIPPPCVLVSMVPCMGITADAAATLYWPVPGHTSLSRGYSTDHPALDISDGSINGATIVAAMGGTVYKVYTCTTQHHGDLHTCGGFGTGVIIKGDDNRGTSTPTCRPAASPAMYTPTPTSAQAP